MCKSTDHVFLKMRNSVSIQGANIDARDISRRTPLLLAALKSSINAVCCLLLKDASLSARDEHDRNLLHFSIIQNLPMETIGKILFCRENFRVLFDQRDTDGYYPIHYASREGQVSVLATLIQHGAEINRKTNERQSSLHFAAQYELEDQIQHKTDESCTLDMVDTIHVVNCSIHPVSNGSSTNQIKLDKHHCISRVKMDIQKLFNCSCTKVLNSRRATKEILLFMMLLPMGTLLRSTQFYKHMLILSMWSIEMEWHHCIWRQLRVMSIVLIFCCQNLHNFFSMKMVKHFLTWQSKGNRKMYA